MDLHEALKFDPPDDKVAAALIADLLECQRMHNSRPWNQFWRRTTIRTAYAMVEGLNNFLKQWAYSYHERNIRSMHHRFRVLNIPYPSPIFAQLQPEADLLLLLEKTVVLNDAGKSRFKDSFSTMEQSIRFMFFMTSRIFQTNHLPDYNQQSWNDLKQGVNVRNRLTHPKTAADLDVKEGEIEMIGRGCQWYMDAAAAAMMKAVGNVRQFDEERLAFFEGLPKEKLVALHKSLSDVPERPQ